MPLPEGNSFLDNSFPQADYYIGLRQGLVQVAKAEKKYFSVNTPFPILQMEGFP